LEVELQKRRLIGQKIVKPFIQKKQLLANKGKAKIEAQPQCKHDIRCFKCQGLVHYASECPNKRVMVVKDDRFIEFASKKSNYDDMPPIEDINDLEFVKEALVVKRSLSVQVK
jgi:hypothetical protein